MYTVFYITIIAKLIYNFEFIFIVTFFLKVKTEQNIGGFGGKKSLCLKINLKHGTLTISKSGEGGSTSVYKHHQGNVTTLYTCTCM